MSLSKSEIEKNKLDLLYQEKAQKINAFYIAASTGVFGFAGTFVWFPEKLFIGGFISLIVFSVFVYFILQTQKDMNSIIMKMDELKNSVHT